MEHHEAGVNDLTAAMARSLAGLVARADIYGGAEVARLGRRSGNFYHRLVSQSRRRPGLQEYTGYVSKFENTTGRRELPRSSGIATRPPGLARFSTHGTAKVLRSRIEVMKKRLAACGQHRELIIS